MSVKIISLHPDNKTFRDLGELLAVIKIFKMEPILASKHEALVENVTDRDVYYLFRLFGQFQDIGIFLRDEELVSSIGCNSGWRPEPINTLVGGVPSSQHPDMDALDLRFYDINNKRITGKGLKPIASAIARFFGKIVIQVIVYETFIHVGFVNVERLDIKLVKSGF